MASRLPTAPRCRRSRDSLSDAGCFRWRREEFDIRADPDGPVLARLDRGALPSFGVLADGRARERPGSSRRTGCTSGSPAAPRTSCWIPCKLDHIVAGGVPAGLTPAETLVKEADEGGRHPRSLASPGGSGRDDQLRHGAPRRTPPRPAALLRPGTAGRLPSSARPTARSKHSSYGRSIASCRPSATRTTSSSTSIWC